MRLAYGPGMDADDPDPLAKLDASARRAPKRARIAVGAAIVCFLLAVAIAAVLSAGGGGDHGELIPGANAVAGDGESGPAGAEVATTGPGSVLLVHVLGAVAKPGLVELSAEARVVDAIAAAGGLREDADPSGVNLARAVTDGEQLIVPAVGEAAAGGTGPGGAGGVPAPGTTGGGGLVHLNTATLADLDTLPRIGPALAQRIIDWRDANGPFTSVDQLREVAGIGEATFAGLVDLVAL